MATMLPHRPRAADRSAQAYLLSISSIFIAVKNSA